MKMKIYQIAALIILVLFLASCTNDYYYNQDEKPQVCTDYEQNAIINNARNQWQTSYDTARLNWLRMHNNNITGFNVTAAPFVPPTGFDVLTHILIYKPDGGLFRNQSFRIDIHPIDEGNNLNVTTVDAKASTQVRYSFTGLNEIEVRVTPIVNRSQYLEQTVLVRKFVPCQDTWFISIDYDLKKNFTTTAEEFDVPALLVEGDLGRVTETHPEIISPGDVQVLEIKIPESGRDTVLAVEYSRAQVQKVELHFNGQTITRGTLPSNESVSTNGNAEIAFGPLLQSGDYELIVFADGSVQPTRKIELKLFDGNSLVRAGDVFFAAKSLIIPKVGMFEYNYNELTVFAVIMIIIFMLIVLRSKR